MESMRMDPKHQFAAQYVLVSRNKYKKDKENLT